ncbi:hypothetical protein [Streptomyces sp. NBC_00572]|uniref:hypothetical protein n=1 Tax=Streptomyces sp. NBC_00572 TaxID=2903664 RepID=UPI002259FBDB|nr:hypothetical protein [Streptomyces sp. NBC_00572]MCX4986598.1 hypothetical protein [Streptomyces sp. NBC_00572]
MFTAQRTSRIPAGARTSVRMAVVALGALAVAALGAAPASAVTGSKAHGDDYAYVDGRYVYVYDGERDGNGVYAEYDLVNGQTGNRLWDGTGHDNVGNSTWASVDVKRFRVCEDHKGCSSWKS